MPTAASSTVAKAFKILELFREHTVLTSSLCEQELGIPRATAHRLLLSLKETGAVEQTQDGHYRLSLTLFELGSLAPQRSGLDESCGIKLEELADRTGFRVHLGVRREFEVLYLEAAHGPNAQAQGLRTRVGYRGPLHATALGKALLTYSDDELVERVIEAGLTPYTPHTITSGSRLRACLADIRQTGIAFGKDEYVLGVGALAVPIRNADGTVSAALSIVGNSGALSRQRPMIEEQARQTAKRIEWRGQPVNLRRKPMERPPLVVAV